MEYCNNPSQFYQERGHGRPYVPGTQAEAQVAHEQFKATGCFFWPAYDPDAETPEEYLASMRALKGE